MLVDRPFDETFVVTRPITAYGLGRTGLPVAFPPDVPILDHDASGRRIGLRVSRGTRFGQGDVVEVNILDDWHDAADADSKMTILHAFRVDGGPIQRRAWYSTNAVQTVNACLSHEALHLSIAAYKGYLPNRGGYVLLGLQRWQTAALLGNTAKLADADARLVIGG